MQKVHLEQKKVPSLALEVPKLDLKVPLLAL